MSFGMAGANMERAAGATRSRRSEVGPAAGRTSRLIDTETKERVAVWDAVAAYIREQLLVHKGVWIPTFGTFDTVSKDIWTETGTMTLQWPVFTLATNLMVAHHLKARRDSLSGHRKVDPLRYSKAAAGTSLSWKTLRTGIQSTVSLLSGCLQNGEKVAVVLKDIGVLLVDGLTFHMKYYFDFLEQLSGKETFRRAASKAPWLLDMVVSRGAPLASLLLSGCLVVFPTFQMEFVPKPPPAIRRKSSGSLCGRETAKKEAALPPLDQGKTVRFAGRPTIIKRLSTSSIDGGHFRRIRSLLLQRSSTSRLLPAIRQVPEAPKQPLPCQLQGDAEAPSQRELGPAPRAKHVSFSEAQLGAENVRGHGVLPTLQAAEASPRRVTFGQTPAFPRSSSRAESSLSSQPPGRHPRFPLVARDSIQVMRMRAQKRAAQQEPQQTAAARPRAEASLPEQSAPSTAASLPPRQEETRSPKPLACRDQSPPCRKNRGQKKALGTACCPTCTRPRPRRIGPPWGRRQLPEDLPAELSAKRRPPNTCRKGSAQPC
ncbi:LOW QUALITY PROTEIN: uncharacterized protein LOC128075734 [Tympanuchus pallidicinctus]|uniref:LOW QUALITY PROTEIN: uncharacterized protein LOC128075734 n=1 Tax=Tympanuchus pallidicinctus TaxID=109042 RepID=UPI002286F5EF|nr:LOW QUALITY PROTEIN: uncharacterized protein LOC128075734 [Tympanuchus pallidicinctus]